MHNYLMVEICRYLAQSSPENDNNLSLMAAQYGRLEEWEPALRDSLVYMSDRTKGAAYRKIQRALRARGARFCLICRFSESGSTFDDAKVVFPGEELPDGTVEVGVSWAHAYSQHKAPICRTTPAERTWVRRYGHLS